MTDQQPEDSVSASALKLRISSHRDGEVTAEEWLVFGGLVHALLIISAIGVYRKETDGSETLLGIGVPFGIPLPDPQDPGGDKVVAWATPKLFLKNGSHRIFARVALDPPLESAALTITIAQPLGKAVITTPAPGEVFHTPTVRVSGHLPANTSFRGATVKVFPDLGPDPLGEKTLLSRNWSFDLAFSTGSHSIVAEVSRGGESTGRSVPVLFHVNPETQA